jgi:hypothetical protein
MQLVQFLTTANERRVAVVSDDGEKLHPLRDTTSVRELALDAYAKQVPLAELATQRASSESVDYAEVIDSNRLLLPLDHPDPAHVYVTGTGLDHLGSAQARDAMHAKLSGATEELTDSMKMFKLGLEGGKPAPGQIGVQPEWFYKGDHLDTHWNYLILHWMVAKSLSLPVSMSSAMMAQCCAWGMP